MSVERGLAGVEFTKAKELFRGLSDFLSGLLGLGRHEKKEHEMSAEEKQKIVKERILENLRKKNALATEEASFNFFEKQFSVTIFSPPEVISRLPGGAIAYDEKANDLKICFNPMLFSGGSFKEDYQLMAVIEEAVHWYQFSHSGMLPIEVESKMSSKARDLEWEKLVCKYEIEAKIKLVKLSKYLQFDESRMKWINHELQRQQNILDLLEHPENS